MAGFLRVIAVALSLAATVALLVSAPAVATPSYDHHDDDDDDDDAGNGAGSSRLKFQFSADLGRSNPTTGVLTIDYDEIERRWTATSNRGDVAYGSSQDFGNLFEDRDSDLSNSTLRDIRRDDLPLVRILTEDDGATTIFEFAVGLELTRIGQGSYTEWLVDGGLYNGLKNDDRSDGEEVQVAFFADIAGLNSVAPTISAGQSDQYGDTVDFLTAPVRRIVLSQADFGVGPQSSGLPRSPNAPVVTSEPASFALLFAALGMLVWTRRRFAARARVAASL